jgi:hypothetical protein
VPSSNFLPRCKMWSVKEPSGLDSINPNKRTEYYSVVINTGMWQRMKSGEFFLKS